LERRFGVFQLTELLLFLDQFSAVWTVYLIELAVGDGEIRYLDEEIGIGLGVDNEEHDQLDGVNGLNSYHFVGHEGTETYKTCVLHYFNQILVDVSDVWVKDEIDALDNQFEVYSRVGTNNIVAVVLQEDIGHLVGDCLIEGKSYDEPTSTPRPTLTCPDETHNHRHPF
jgi:hypothetical protein